MRAVTFVLPDEMANVSIAGLQWFILIPRLKHTGCHRPIYSHSIPYLHREKIYDLEQELPSLLQSYKLRGKQLLVSDFSRLLRHATEKGRAPILYSKEKPGTPQGFSKFKEFPNDENVTKQKPFQRVEVENIRKKFHQIIY